MKLEFSTRTRNSSWEKLKKNPSFIHDLLIVGGGIVGAGLIKESILSGIQNSILIDKGDFASGTSHTSSKLIHAGIRYLEQVWIQLKSFRILSALSSFNFVWSASFERKRLGKSYPHLIKPKKIYLVLGTTDQRSVLSVLTGVWVYYLIQLFQGQFFSSPEFYLNKNTIKNNFPELDVSNVKAVLSFWDSETDDSRLVFEVIRDAHENGGICLNYVELISFEESKDVVASEIRNNETNEVITVRSKALINASGPWVDRVRKLNATLVSKKETFIDKIAGAHLDFFPEISKKSFYVTASDGRFIFILTRNEDGLQYTRVGTTERIISEENVASLTVSLNEENYLIENLKSVLDPNKISKSSILRKDEGIRPLRSQSGHDSFNKSREHDIVIEERICHVIGVKLTDFRRVSEEVLNLIPLEKWGIKNVNAPKRLNSKQPLHQQCYIENTAQEIANQLMVVHLSDYVLRRHGLKPLLLRKFDKSAFNTHLLEILDCLKIPESQRSRELEYLEKDLQDYSNQL